MKLAKFHGQKSPLSTVNILAMYEDMDRRMNQKKGGGEDYNTYSISQKRVHPSHFCNYFILFSCDNTVTV